MKNPVSNEKENKGTNTMIGDECVPNLSPQKRKALKHRNKMCKQLTRHTALIRWNQF